MSDYERSDNNEDRSASSFHQASTSKGLLEFVASLPAVETLSSSDSEVEFVEELKVSVDDHRCDLCCEGEFLVKKIFHFGGLLNNGHRFICEYCDKTFKYKSELKKHKNHSCSVESNENAKENKVADTEHGKKTCSLSIACISSTCTICHKVLKSQRGLARHKKNQHSYISHKCEICQQVFFNFRQFKLHCNGHKQNLTYMCPKCDKKFLWEKTLKQHLSTHLN